MKRIKITDKSYNVGEQNSQYGTCWIFNMDKQKSIKIKKEEIDLYLNNGWKRGHVINFNSTILYKKHWYHNEELQECKLFTIVDVPNGWVKGKKKYKINYSTHTLGINYKIFSKENISIYTSHEPGIYHIFNKVNGKSYIGQAKKLRTRLLAHLRHYMNGNRKYPIYKAFAMYGLENFEFSILSIYESNDPDLQQKLDNDETKYIKEYNSYGATGYNQTYGGDAGITGYKFTKEQCKHASENSKRQAADGRYKIYVYNLNTKTYEEYPNIQFLNNHYNLNIFSSSVNNIICNNFLVLSRTKDGLEEKLQKIKSTITYIIPDDFKEYYNNHTIDEICKKYNICKSTIYNWLKQLNIKTTKRVVYKEIPEDFKEYYLTHTTKEICEKYNILRDTIYNWLKKLNMTPSKKK